MQRVSIFVDGANMYYAQKKLGWYIDFRKVLTYFGKDTGNAISEAYYYTGADMQSKGRDGAFHEYLMYSGYTVRTKAIKQLVDTGPQPRRSFEVTANDRRFLRSLRIAADETAESVE